eukprot:gene1921-2974_t
MPIVARWIIYSKFGHKPAVALLVNLIAQSSRSKLAVAATPNGLDGDGLVARRARHLNSRFPQHGSRILTGRVGAEENRVEWESVHDNISALEACWARFGDPTLSQAHKDWSKSMELSMQFHAHSSSLEQYETN